MESGGYSAGKDGFTTLHPNVESTRFRPPLPYPVSGFIATRGARGMLSTPPDRTSFPSPDQITLAASLTASRPEPQSLFTVAAGTEKGIPARSEAILATFLLSSP